jgi:hypothetical protein
VFRDNVVVMRRDTDSTARYDIRTVPIGDVQDLEPRLQELGQGGFAYYGDVFQRPGGLSFSITMGYRAIFIRRAGEEPAPVEFRLLTIKLAQRDSQPVLAALNEAAMMGFAWAGGFPVRQTGTVEILMSRPLSTTVGGVQYAFAETDEGIRKLGTEGWRYRDQIPITTRGDFIRVTAVMERLSEPAASFDLRMVSNTLAERDLLPLLDQGYTLAAFSKSANLDRRREESHWVAVASKPR